MSNEVADLKIRLDQTQSALKRMQEETVIAAQSVEQSTEQSEIIAGLVNKRLNDALLTLNETSLSHMEIVDHLLDKTETMQAATVDAISELRQEFNHYRNTDRYDLTKKYVARLIRESAAEIVDTGAEIVDTGKDIGKEDEE